MNFNDNNDNYGLDIMLAEMPAPISTEGHIVVNHVEMRHPQLTSYPPISSYQDYPELGSC